MAQTATTLTTSPYGWCRPLRPDVQLSTGKIITHSYDPNGSQIAWPAMTKAESAEYHQLVVAP